LCYLPFSRHLPSLWADDTPCRNVERAKLRTKLISPMMTRAHLITIERTRRPLMVLVMNANICSIRARIDDFLRLLSFCFSLSCRLRYPPPRRGRRRDARSVRLRQGVSRRLALTPPPSTEHPPPFPPPGDLRPSTQRPAPFAAHYTLRHPVSWSYSCSTIHRSPHPGSRPVR